MKTRLAATTLALCAVTNVAGAAQEAFNVVNVGVDLSLNSMFVQVDHNSTSSTCAVKSIFMWSLSTSTRDVLALAASALAAGKTVNIGVSEGGLCVNGYATGTWLRVDG